MLQFYIYFTCAVEALFLRHGTHWEHGSPEQQQL